MSFVLLRIAIVAISLALDVFAVSVGVGVTGVSFRSRLRIGASFAVSEVAMTAVGVGLGAAAGRLVGDVAAYFGYAALVVIGSYIIVESTRGTLLPRFDLSRGWGLVLASLSISMDSLGIGFSIVYLGVPLYWTLGAIALASGLSTTLGLTFGGALGLSAGRRAGTFAGGVLALTGLTFALLKLTARL